MDLEKINSEYVQFKKELENVKKEKDTISKQVARTKNDLTILKATRDNAELDGNQSKMETYEKAIEQKKRILETIGKELTEKTAKLIEIQRKIDDRIEEIQNDPEMKEHLDRILAKRYARQIKAIKEEKNLIVEKKERFIKIDDLAKKHDSVKKKLIGMTNAQKEIKALTKELDSLTIKSPNGGVTYTDPLRANEIETKLLPIAKGKYSKNKDLFVNYAKSQNISINEKDLLELTGVLAQNKGNINIEGTIERQINGFSKQIKARSVQILNYSDAISKINKNYEKQEGPQVQNDSQNAMHPKTPTTDVPAKTSFFRGLFTRFKEWRIRRNQKALGFGEYDVNKTEEPKNELVSQPTVNTTSAKKENEFSRSLKYDILKDYDEQYLKKEFDKTKQAGIEAGIKAGRKQKTQSDVDRDRD